MSSNKAVKFFESNPPHPNPLPQGERENIRESFLRGERGKKENAFLYEPWTQGERELNNPPPLMGGGEGEGGKKVFSEQKKIRLA